MRHCNPAKYDEGGKHAHGGFYFTKVYYEYQKFHILPVKRIACMKCGEVIK